MENNNNTYEQQKTRSSSFSDEREKFLKRSNDNIHLETITEVYHQTNPNKNEYFFPRHSSSFESILYYYIYDGVLIKSEIIPAIIFYEEIRFFQLNFVSYLKFQL